jgi:DNA relaxase NicK
MKTAIDWLSFRTKTDPFKTLEALQPIFGTAADLVTFVPGAKGRDGWQRAGDVLMAGDIKLGWIDYGGESQRGWVRVQLYGEGCQWVQDWQAVEQLGEALQEADIRRLDIALTTYNDEVTDAMIVQAHSDGMFTTSGRPPHMKSVGSSDPRAGITRYIGTREKSDKFLRCYQKGLELLQHIPAHLRASTTHIDGYDVLKTYRVELELKAVEKYIPWTAIGRRDHVFAGAYPFLAQLLPLAPHWKMLKLPDFKPKAAITSTLEHCRVAYGGAIRMAVDIYGPEKTLEMILGDKPSRALIDAGVLTISPSELTRSTY